MDIMSTLGLDESYAPYSPDEDFIFMRHIHALFSCNTKT